MRYNKDFIAETLAEAAQNASEETRRRMDAHGLDKRSGLESIEVHNSRERASVQAEAKHLRIHNQVRPLIPGSAIVWLILLFLFPAVTLAQSSLLTAESRAQNAYPAILPKSPALRPASASIARKKS